MKLNSITRMFGTLVLLVALQMTAFGQGVTTSSIFGKVVDPSGEPLIGATVLAVHGPSGTSYGSATNLEGFYRIPNMRVGGPYRITVSYTGFESLVKDNVTLSLGQAFRFNPALQETAYTLEGVVVSAGINDVFDGSRNGQKTVVDARTISDIPTISRAIADYARFNPLATIGEDDDGFTISLAGQNNRYNTIYIDGAVNNDAFGLADSGTNGGQTGIQPISIDAIEQFTIAVAPFDVRQSGFAGGSINAVTKSGSNDFKGSAYYLFRNESLQGNTTFGTEPTPFSALTYGMTLGGPIKKDKLFFFVNAEIKDDETPNPFDFGDYVGTVGASKIGEVRDAFQERYGYDIGSFDANTAYLEGLTLLGKIDWNINDKHKLSLRHSYVNGENLEARSSDRNDIRFLNGSEFFITTTNSTALEVNSIFNANLANKFSVGATFVRDDRDPLGNPFPTVELFDDNIDWQIGAERFSTANRLDQDVVTITNDLSIYKGRHSLVFGANFEYFSAANLFIRNNYGRYQWEDDDGMTGIDRFLAGMPATRFERSFSQVDNVAGDESAAIGAFEQMLFGVYVQDEYQANDRLTLTGGLRVDFPIWPTDQPINEEFNNTTIPNIEGFGYDLRGARTGSFIGGSVAFAPRFGFNWDVKGDKTTQVRGGIGLFTSRIPLVWPGGAYNNYGFNIGATGGRNVAFNPDVQKQPVGFDDDGNPITAVNLADPVPSGQIDLFAEDFKLPQVLKINVAVDQKLPWGLIGSLEGLFSQNINAPYYQNLNLKPSNRTLTGSPDNRPLFLGTQSAFGDDVIEPTYTYIMLASSINKGYAYNLAATLTKPFTNGFSGTLSYSYSDAYSVLDGTSSQNNSQWRGYHNVAGRNFVRDAQRSTFAGGHRIFGQFSYQTAYKIAGDFGGKSKLSLNFNAQTGGYFSYVIGARNFRFTDDGGFDNNELIYVPENQSDIPLVDLEHDGRTYSPAEQWALLDAFIEDDPGLSKRRGEYSQRNDGREPFEFGMDLRFVQDFYIKTASGRTNTLQLTVDIFNFTNLLNADWGRVRFAGSFGNYDILNLANRTDGTRGTTPEYTINRDLIDGLKPWEDNFDNAGLRSSIWNMQIGVRYIFD